MVTVNMDMVETNIVLVRVDRHLSTARRMVELLSRADWPVLALEWDTHTLRLVTHRDITESSLSCAEDTIRTVLKSLLEDRRTKSASTRSQT